jgi:hypothetical protein
VPFLDGFVRNEDITERRREQWIPLEEEIKNQKAKIKNQK